MKSNKRLLIIFPTDYYLFNYIYELSIFCRNFFSKVEVITLEESVKNKLRKRDIDVQIFPRPLIFLHKLSANIFFRAIAWMSFRFFYFTKKNDFDVVFLPWDNKLIYISALPYFKSCTSHNTFNLVHLGDEIEANRSKTTSSFLNIFEQLLKKNIAPKLCGVTLKHNYLWYFDKAFGMRAQSYVQGFSGVDLMTVTGSRIKENLRKAGLEDTKTKLEVTGNPNYDGLLEKANKITDVDLQEFKDTFSIKNKQDVFTLFLSPTSFSADQINEIKLVIELIKDVNDQSFIILKLHPKTQKRFSSLFKSICNEMLSSFHIIDSTTTDIYNMKLILLSKAIIQKQSTVGFMAMILGKPIISYNLISTGYFDDLYKRLNCSFHAESEEQFISSLKRLDSLSDISELKTSQEIACKKFCLRINNPNKLICEAIDFHL